MPVFSRSWAQRRADATRSGAWMLSKSALDGDSLDLVQRDFISRTVVELGGSWRFVTGDGLSILNGATVFQIGRDAGGPEGVATGGGGEIGCPSSAFYHGQHFVAVQRLVCQRTVPVERSKDETFPV